MPNVAASDAAITVTVLDYSYVATLSLHQLPYTTWTAAASTYATAFTSALARDAKVDRFQAHVLAVRDGAAAGRRALQQATPATSVDVRVDGFGDGPADVALAANALSSAAVSTSSSGSYIRAAMRHVSALAVTTAQPSAGGYSVTVQLGIGVLAGAANAPSGAQIAANLAAALASGTKAAALSNSVGGTAVAAGAPSGNYSAISVAPPSTFGGVATPVPVAASKSTKSTAPVAAGVGGGGFLIFMLIVCGCFMVRGMRRRAAAANADAVWVDMPGQQQQGVPVYNPMMQQQQQQQQPGYAPSGGMYMAPSGANYAQSGATYYAQPAPYGGNRGQVYVNPLAQPPGGVAGYPVQMTVIAPRANQLQDFQAEQRALYPSPVGSPPMSPVWELQPQPRASDPGLDAGFALRQSRAARASSAGQMSHSSQGSIGQGDQPPYAHS